MKRAYSDGYLSQTMWNHTVQKIQPVDSWTPTDACRPPRREIPLAPFNSLMLYPGCPSNLYEDSDATKCCLKWLWSCLPSLRFWKCLKASQIIKTRTILAPVERKGSGARRLPFTFYTSQWEASRDSQLRCEPVGPIRSRAKPGNLGNSYCLAECQGGGMEKL